MPEPRAIYGERGVDWCEEESGLELVRPELALPRNHAVAMREVCGQVVESEREPHLVEVVVHAERLSEIVECIMRAGLAGHHVGVGDDERPIGTELGDETAQPRRSVAQVAIVVHHSVRGVG